MPAPAHESHRIAAGTASAGATVHFTWAGDRWQHRGVVHGPSAESAAGTWESVEGPCPADADVRWPASPVLVELSPVVLSGIEPADRRAIVGVGLAGRSHFSAAIAPDPDRPGAIRFEIACRLSEPPGWLGSTYRFGPRLVRVVPRNAAGPLPRTVTWSYSIGPDGLNADQGSDVFSAAE